MCKTVQYTRSHSTLQDAKESLTANPMTFPEHILTFSGSVQTVSFQRLRYDVIKGHDEHFSPHPLMISGQTGITWFHSVSSNTCVGGGRWNKDAEMQSMLLQYWKKAPIGQCLLEATHTYLPSHSRNNLEVLWTGNTQNLFQAGSLKCGQSCFLPGLITQLYLPKDDSCISVWTPFTHKLVSDPWHG